MFRFRVSLTGTQAQDAKIVDGLSPLRNPPRRLRELKWPSDSLIMNPAAGTDKEVYDFHLRSGLRNGTCFRYKITYQKLPDAACAFVDGGGRTWHELQPCKPESASRLKLEQSAFRRRFAYKLELTGKDAANANLERQLPHLTRTTAGI